MAKKKQPSLPWHEDGLRFKCTQCGNCCRVEGWVWVEDEEIDEIAAYLEMTKKDFKKT